MMKRIRYCDECGCDREVEVTTRNSTYTFRKEPFEIIEEYAYCPICGKDVTDEELDDKTLKKLSELYNVKHSITPEMLKETRTTFNISQALFAKLLNMGIATIKRYELGTSSPDSTQIGIYKLLKSNPKAVQQFLYQNKPNFESDELKLVQERLAPFLTNNEELEDTTQRLLEITYKPHENTLETGDRYFDYQKLMNMILYFSRNGVLKTKLMKLLWYGDFLRYKRNKVSISGTPYWHLPYGPVPKKHEMVLGNLEAMNVISIKEEENNDGYTRILINSKIKFEANLFSAEEWDVLRYVEEYFQAYGSTAISNFTHLERGWKETEDEQIISYKYAECLQLQ